MSIQIARTAVRIAAARLACAFSVLLAAVASAQVSTTIDTFAGDGIGDGYQAALAYSFEASGSDVDADGNLYFAEGSRIRKVTPAGIISTVAGTGVAGFSGDGGPATEARLNWPNNLVVDVAGNLYIADHNNYRIRRVDTSGTITTVVGNGYYDYSGEGTPALDTAVWSIDSLAIAPNGNLAWGDYGQHRVRELRADGKVYTLAGNGEFDGGSPTSAGDGGPATGVTLSGALNIAFDAQGRLLISERGGGVIRRVAAGIATTAFGVRNGGSTAENVPAATAAMPYPADIDVDAAGNILVAFPYQGTIRRIGTNGNILTIAGGGAGAEGTPALGAAIGEVEFVTAHPDGRVIIGTGGDYDPLRSFTVGGNLQRFAGGGDGVGGPNPRNLRLNDTSAVAFDPQGNVLAAVGGRILRIPQNGASTVVAGVHQTGYSPDGTPAAEASLAGRIAGVAVAPDGLLFYSGSESSNGSFIRYVDATGKLQTLTSAVGGGPLYFGANGDIYTIGAYRIVRVTRAGVVTTIGGNGVEGFDGDGGQATAAQFGIIGGFVRAADGTMYVADRSALRVRRIAPDGIVTTVAGDGSYDETADDGVATAVGMSDLVGLALDSQGRLLIADGERIRRLDSDGMLRNYAGDGTYGYGGDNGPALAAQLVIDALAVDGTDRLYVGGEERIRRVWDTTSPVLPSAPRNVVAVAGAGEVQVTFVAPVASGSAPVLSYVVESTPAAGTDAQAGTTALSHRITGLANGQWYTFTVRAVTAAGTGPRSATSATVVPRPVPPVPVATAGNAKATVSFPAWSPGLNPPTNYVVRTVPATRAEQRPTLDPFEFTGLQNGTEYRFTVRPVYPEGAGATSAQSNPVTPSATAVVLPSVPVNVVAVGGDGEVQVTFEAPATTGSSPILRYVVTSTPAAGTDAQAGSTALSHRITGLANGQPYTFTVHAVTADGDGARSPATAAIVPRPAPPVPSATAGNAKASLTFPAWSAGLNPPTGFEIRTQPATRVEARTSLQAFDFTGLQNGTAYSFSLRAIYPEGAGQWSAPSNAVTPVAPPQVPTIANASIAEGNSGSTNLVFTLSVPLPAAADITIPRVETAAGTATASDYTAAVATGLKILAGQTSVTYTVSVLGDVVPEADETFTVLLKDAGMSTFAQATGTILNDDGAVDAVFYGVPDRFTHVENGAEIALDVLANDGRTPTSLNGGRFEIVQAPANGTARIAALNPAGPQGDVVMYRPKANWSGEDVLVYRACDTGGTCYDEMAVVRVHFSATPTITTRGQSGRSAVINATPRALANVRFAATPLVTPQAELLTVPGDTRPSTPWESGRPGTITRLYTLPADGQPAAWQVTVALGRFESERVRAYVGVDGNGDGQPSADEVRCTASMDLDEEFCELPLTHPGTGTVRYWVMLHNPDLAAREIDLHVAAVPMTDTDGRLVATGPSRLAAGDSIGYLVSYNDPLVVEGELAVGYVRVLENNVEIDRVPVQVRVAPDAATVTGADLGNGLPYTLRLQGGQAHERLFVDVPAGASSLTVTTDSDSNIDLYLAKGSPTAAVAEIGVAPARSAAAASAIGASGDETLTISGPALAAGRWYVTPVNKGTSLATATITATIANAAAPVVRSGSYFNAARSGHGIFLYPAANQWAGLWYTYESGGRATWYYIQAAKPGVDGIWRAPLFHSAWTGSGNRLTKVGHVTVTPTAADAFVFTHEVHGLTGSEPMAALGRGCPTLGGTPVDASSHWFNPATAGSGFSVQFWSNYEFFAAFVYDGQGAARFLTAERNGFGGADATLSLEQLRGTPTTSAWLGNPVRFPVGTLRRVIANGVLSRIEVAATYTDGVPGSWNSIDPVVALGGAGTTQGCAP